MFLDFYNLREQPFGITPNPRDLFLSPPHREALASLHYGLVSGRGFLTLIAKPGMGKTTLLFQLLERLRSSARTVFLFQTLCGPRELMRYLLADLGVETGEKDLVRLHSQLNEVLARQAAEGKRTVLVIDEAQNLADSALEMVRLLSNFETPTSKLLQIVLAGQPELAEKLMGPRLAQLRQRVAMVCRLEPFTPAETESYIAHRLRIAGHDGSPLFTRRALSLLAEQAEGIPRTINHLCFNALSLGCALHRKTIDGSLMREVVADSDLKSLVPSQSEPSPALGSSVSSWLQRPGWLTRERLVRSIPVAAFALTIAFALGLSFSRLKQNPVKAAVSAAGSEQKSALPQTLMVAVKQDETLERISVRYLGRFDSALLKEIRALNPELEDPNHIEVGQQIRLPFPVSTQVVAAPGAVATEGLVNSSLSRGTTP